MAKKIPTFTSDIVSSACSDINGIVEAKSLNQDDMRKPFGSPPPRRSFFPRARDATMGFEYRPVR